jgi:hypothetical protein
MGEEEEEEEEEEGAVMVVVVKNSQNITYFTPSYLCCIYCVCVGF